MARRWDPINCKVAKIEFEFKIIQKPSKVIGRVFFELRYILEWNM